MAAALDETFPGRVDGFRGLLRTSGESRPYRGQENSAYGCRDLRFFVERTTGFEPATPTLARLCSTN